MQRRFDTNDLIGEYRVTGFLGEGGMGEVYKGVHENLKRPAAIKILSAGVDDPNFKTRFFNEARLQAGLHHPNIAALYDFRELDGKLFIFMEFVDGECLEDVIRRRSMSIDETLKTFISICEAVDYIHRSGVVHRDLKSQNIKITSDGKVKLLDFGIAKDASSLGLTQVGGVIGTPHYLAPEQLGGEPATPRADIWALGVLLYEMLTGEMPFKSESLGTLVYKISNVHFTPPEDMNSAIPAAVADIVKKCLQKDTDDRYQTIGDMQGEIRRFLDASLRVSTADTEVVISGAYAIPRATPLLSLVSVADQHGDEDRHVRPAIRWPLILAAAGSVVAVFFVILAGTGVWLMGGSDEPAPNTPAGPANARKLASAQPAAKSNAQRVRVDVDEGKAKVIRDGQLLGETPYDLDAATGENVALTLQRDGFQDKNVSFEVSTQKKVFTFSMKQK